MPTYIYRCTDCDYEFEARQRMTDDPLTECPKCHGKIRRVVNSVGVVFKGKGFYVTDNRGSNAQAPTSGSKKESGSENGVKESSAKESGESSASRKSESTESKPAKKEKSNDS